MGWPINRVPEAVSPLVAILEVSPEKGCEIGEPQGSGDVARDGLSCNSEGATGSRNERD